MITRPVYLEIVDFFAAGTTTQEVIDYQPSPEVKAKALTLLELAKQDCLTEEQESELNHLTELEHILRLTKARGKFSPAVHEVAQGFARVSGSACPQFER